MNITTDRPDSKLRVSRCTAGHGYFAWPGPNDIGCLVCGDVLATTTRNQRQQPWQILDKAEAEQASRLDGGLPHQIRWERRHADDYFNRAAECLLDDSSILEIVTEENAARYRYQELGDRVWRRNHSGQNIDSLLREGTRLLAKAMRLQRKLDKLGGPKEAQ